jgi:hypothetical protein
MRLKTVPDPLQDGSKITPRTWANFKKTRARLLVNMARENEYVWIWVWNMNMNMIMIMKACARPLVNMSKSKTERSSSLCLLS